MSSVLGDRGQASDEQLRGQMLKALNADRVVL
jgi:hypothetical protein